MEKCFEVKEKLKCFFYRIFVNGSCVFFWSGLISWVDWLKEVFNFKLVYWFMLVNFLMFFLIFKFFVGLYILFINILNVYFYFMGYDFLMWCFYCLKI